jgi:hypothetical protein
MMALKTDLLSELRQAVDATALCNCILASEQAVLADRRHAPDSSPPPE